MAGRYNVSYSDLNELAYPVLRHRMKLNFEAVAERISPDEIVKQIVEEVSAKFKGGEKKNEEAEVTEVKKKSFFSKK